LTPSKLSDLWRFHPAVNETISIGPDESAFSIGRRLRAGGFDLALLLPNSPRSAIEAWLGKIPHRIGLAGGLRNWFLTEAVPARPGRMRMRKRSSGEIRRLINSAALKAGEPGGESQGAGPGNADFSAHQVHEYLHLTAALGADPDPLPPQLAVSPSEVGAAAQKFGLHEAGAGALPIFSLIPGVEYGPAKRWPQKRFAAAARQIHERANCLWLLLGGEADAGLAGEIASEARLPDSSLRNLAGQTSLRDLMALLKLSRVLLANDSGPMHVAAALGTPVVVPFGSTSPELTGPGLPGASRHRLIRTDAPCSPCFLRQCPIDFRCMTGISVPRVVDAVLAAASGAR